MITKQSQLDLEDLKVRFDNWRNNRKSKTGRIPDALWESAVSLYPNHTIYKISKTLSLDYIKLKSLIGIKSKPSETQAPQFVEITSQIEHSTATKVCFERSDGSKMSIEFENGPDVNSLIKSFLGNSI